MRFVICVHPDKGFREILLSIWERLGWDRVEVLHGLQIQDAVPIQVLAENKIIIPVAMLNEPVEFRVVIDIVLAVENLASLTLQLAFASTLWIILVFIFIVPHFEYKGASFGIQLYFFCTRTEVFRTKHGHTLFPPILVFFCVCHIHMQDSLPIMGRMDMDGINFISAPQWSRRFHPRRIRRGGSS